MSTNCPKLKDSNHFSCAPSVFAKDFISKGG
jgi:hypothetical protein